MSGLDAPSWPGWNRCRSSRRWSPVSPGAAIGWRRDAPAFGLAVAGISLGSDCVMRFQRRAPGGERRVFKQPLARRSGYVLAGASRWVWQHSMPAVAQERYSITFRTLKAAGRS